MSTKAQQPALEKTVGKARFAGAQRRIKRQLNLIHDVDQETYIALGHAIDEAANALVQCWTDFARPPKDNDKGPEPQVLSGHLAMTGLMSLVPSGSQQQESLAKYVNEALDKFWGVD